MAAFVGKFSGFLPSKIKHKFGSVNSSLTLTFPERFKGTLVEKWAKYWKNLLNDYKEVGRETVKDIRTKPVKSAIIASGMGAVVSFMCSNPDETCFRDTVLTFANEMALVPNSILNPKAAEHLKYLETCYNQGIIRRLNLGIASFMWIDNYDSSLGLYPSQCLYLKPRYTDFHERIIDFGFLGRWWSINRIMVDFDINPSEWEKSQEQ